MIDTVHLWVGIDGLGEMDIMAEIPLKLDNYTIHQPAKGPSYVTGGWKGMKVHCTEFMLSIKGSLSKMYKGNNFWELNQHETRDAFSQISCELGIDLAITNISRVDIGWNLIVNYPPENYFPYMGEARYFKRLRQDSSLYYQNCKYP